MFAKEVLFCNTALNVSNSKLPDLIDIKANAIMINKTEMCINTRYLIPAFKTSFLLLSNITRKNELNDIISQQIKNIKAF